MYLQKLNISDLQSKEGAYDGEMSYAQNKRQQVIYKHRFYSIASYSLTSDNVVREVEVTFLAEIISWLCV